MSSTAAAVVLQDKPRLAALLHVVDLVSSFLDGSVRYTAPQAAATGSVRLLTRVIARLLRDEPEEALREYWLSLAMETAIKRDDVLMVQCIHAVHPLPLELFSMRLAFEHATLEMVQWVVETRHDRVCCLPGIQSLCRACLNAALDSMGGQDAARVFQWLMDEGVLTVDGVARLGVIESKAFLTRRANYEWLEGTGAWSDRLRTRALYLAIASGDQELVEYLLEQKPVCEDTRLRRNLMKAACGPATNEFVEFLIETPLFERLKGEFEFASHRPDGAKVIQWKADAWPEVASHVSDVAWWFMHVDTLKWMYDVYGADPDIGHPEPPCEEDLLEYYKWKLGAGFGYWSVSHMDTAASMGYLHVVKWLHEHRTEGCTSRAMGLAAAGGHLDVVRWLHSHREVCTLTALNLAAFVGNLDVVRWLRDNRSAVDPMYAILTTARVGHLEVLMYLYENSPHACSHCIVAMVIAQTDGTECRPLNALRWLNARPPAASCRGCCLNSNRLNDWYLTGVAASEGDIRLLEYLRQHHNDSVRVHIERGFFGAGFAHAGLRYEGGTRPNPHGGHLRIAEWLQQHFRDVVNWSVLPDDAMRVGDIDVVSWLNRNPLE